MFHVTPSGVERCRATKRACPYGPTFISQEFAHAQEENADLSEQPFSGLYKRDELDHDDYTKKSRAYLKALSSKERYALADYVQSGYQDMNYGRN